MSLLTRDGSSIVSGAFGMLSDVVPERPAPAATVTQLYDPDTQATWLAVEITGAVSGAISYSVVVINVGTLAIIATATIAGDTVAPVGPLPPVAVNTELLYRISANPNGVALQGSHTQTPLAAIAIVTAPVLFAVKVGDVFQITPPVWNVRPVSESYVIQEDADGVGAGTTIVPTPTLAPAPAGKYHRVGFTAVGPLGDSVTSYSAYIGPIQAAPGPTLFKLTSANITLGPSVYWPAAQTTYFKPTIVTAGIPGGNIVQWAASSAISYPVPLEAHWKNLELYGGDLVPAYNTLATDATTRPPNFSLWQANPDSPDRANLRFRHGDGVNWSQASDPAWYIEAPAEVLPDPAALVYRQLIRRTDLQTPGIVTPDNPDFYDGIFMGDGQQYFPSMAFSANGAKVLAGQDCATPMMSLTSGRTWFRPRSLGLKLLMTRGVAADPANASRWFALCSASYQTTKQSLSGLYVSGNDSESWTRLVAVPDMGNTQTFVDNITCYPAAGGPAAKWYFAINGEKTAAAYFGKSGADNGATWGALTSLAWATYGRIYKLEASRHASGTLFMATELGGLRRSTNDGASWSVMPGNLPTTKIRWFWIDPASAGHMYAVAASSDTAVQGLYETSNATAATPTWTRIRSCPAHWAAVGALSGGQRAIYVKCGSTGSGTTAANNTDHIRQRDGTWITRATSPTKINLNMAGAQPDTQPFNGMSVFYTTLLGNGQQMTGVQAHPTNPDFFLVHGNTSFFTTSDQGLNVNLSMAGYGGLNMRSTHYDPYDKNSIVASCQDVDPGISITGGRSMFTKPMHSFEGKCKIVSGLALDSFHGWTITKVPGDVTAVAWRNRIIFASGPSNSIVGAMGYINADGTTGDWMGDTPTQGQTNANGGGWAARPSSGFLRHDHNKVWCGTNKIDLGATTTWGVTNSSRPILGAAQDGTDTVYAFGGQVIYRSTDFGASWSTFYTFASPMLDLGAPIGRPSLYDGRRMFFRNSTRSFTMLFDNGGTAVATVFDLATTLDTDGQRIFDSPYAIDASIAAIVGDMLDERYLHLATNTMGTAKRVYRGKFNAGFTAITWENITSNGSHGASGFSLFTTGVHGSLHTSPKDHGSYIFPTPTDWQPRVGTFRFSGQPANNQTLLINGQTMTFKTTGAVGLQVNIGASLSATLTALATMLNASVHASITPCTYTARYGNLLEVTMDDPTAGVDEPFPLTAGTTANATVINAAVPCRDRVWFDCPLPIYTL